MSVFNLVKQVEAQCPSVLGNGSWEDLKIAINEAYPTLVPIQIGRKYEMDTKKGPVTVQVTKENQKTWVMYELDNSVRPGCRWMVGKTWCIEGNIYPVNSDAKVPAHVRIK